MPERQSFIDRVKGAEREYHVVAVALEFFQRISQASTPALPYKSSPRDLARAIDKAESTYLIRMWAEFETSLRSYHARIAGKTDDRMSSSNLINWTAGVRRGRSISRDLRDAVHEMREYRNYLVHDRDERDPPSPISIDDARGRLNTLLHCLPESW